jgi:glycosyltransferase 2 family protein
MQMPKRKWMILFIKVILLAAVLFFVGKAISQAIFKISWADLDINNWFLMLSVFFEIATRLFVGLFYGLLLRYFKSPVYPGVAVAVSWISFLGKYVPGKVAVLGSAVYLLSRYNVRRAVAAVVPVIATIMTVAVSLLLSIPLLFSSLSGDLAVFANFMVVFIVLASVMAIRPHIFIKPGNYLLQKMGYSPIETGLYVKQALGGICIVLGQCYCAGLSTWCFVNAFVSSGLETLPMIISITVFAGAVGLLALFSPAGIGVRDGIYFLFFGPLMGVEMAALVVVCLRLLQTIIDLLTAGLGWLLLRRWPTAIKNGS